MINIVSDIICDTFRKEVGTWGGNPPGKSHGKPQKALVISFSASLDWEKEDGYRNFDLLLYAEANYVGVYFKERWVVRPVLGEGYGEYTEGTSEWKSLTHHDSCWPDGVSRFLRDNERKIMGLDSLNRWFKISTLTITDLEELLEAREKVRI